MCEELRAIVRSLSQCKSRNRSAEKIQLKAGLTYSDGEDGWSSPNLEVAQARLVVVIMTIFDRMQDTCRPAEEKELLPFRDVLLSSPLTKNLNPPRIRYLKLLDHLSRVVCPVMIRTLLLK